MTRPCGRTTALWPSGFLSLQAKKKHTAATCDAEKHGGEEWRPRGSLRRQQSKPYSSDHLHWLQVSAKSSALLRVILSVYSLNVSS